MSANKKEGNMDKIIGLPRLKKTRFDNLTYANVQRGVWSFFHEGARVGPPYASKEELLADLSRYAADFGYDL